MGRLRDGIAAGAVGGVLGALPSTVYGLLTGSVADPTLAAGAILFPDETSRRRLVVAAVFVHVTLSLGWGVTLATLLPRRRPVAEGTLAGLAIAALDLGIGRRLRPAVADLPLLPQIADHVAYGVAVGAMLGRPR